MKKVTQVHHINQDDLTEIILEGVEKKLNELKLHFTPKQPTQLLNRKETSIFFGVSTMTVDSWVQKGILKAYRTGNRKFFKRSELEKALTKINK